MGVKLHTLRELRSLSPEDMRSLSSYLREWAEEKEAGADPEERTEPETAEEITVGELNSLRERLRKVDPYLRGEIYTTLRNDLMEDMYNAQQEGTEIKPDFRGAILRNVDAIKDDDLLEGIYYGTETSKREQKRREEACRNG